ncbi:hypothetical protein J2W56_002013 [Nocardia kruczakiae]|uniref:Uncharacterized protein n=1 Tax=Nocardia kruczakiae TaxID=261477 RepID=A0ABU1XE51_9NOCA|nr:hypothetical protein [Nocardia kruczakiae]MDR7168282.1 hypothetical protein [Nocardia kruczakiae]
MVPWFVERLDETLPMNNTGLERSISDNVRHDVYITPSGMFSGSQLRFCLDVPGVDRIIISVDCPFVSEAGAREFITGSGLSVENSTR